MKLRTVLLGFSALFVAINAGYFSVIGLSKLFAGASESVIIMASSLEIAKLLTAGFLYNYWNHINKLLRTYLILGVVVLIMITSAGIYGFLTSAYQTTSDHLTILDKRVELVITKRDRFQIQYDEYAGEKKSLQQTISELSKGLSNNVIQYRDKESGEIITTTSARTRRTLTNQLNDNKLHRDKISTRMDALSDSITSLDLQALNVKMADEVATEVGPLKYIAEITGKPMSTIVNWFALFIIFVFDPLAVTLIVAFNVALKVDNGTITKSKIEEDRPLYRVVDDEVEIDRNKKSMESTKIANESDVDDQSIDELQNSPEPQPKEILDEVTSEINKSDKDVPIPANDIEITDYVNVTELNLRQKYENGDWKNSFKNTPYFHHPWFDWNKIERWKDDPLAIKYWKAFKGGSHEQLNSMVASYAPKSYSTYPNDFLKKTY